MVVVVVGEVVVVESCSGYRQRQERERGEREAAELSCAGQMRVRAKQAGLSSLSLPLSLARNS